MTQHDLIKELMSLGIFTRWLSVPNLFQLNDCRDIYFRLSDRMWVNQMMMETFTTDEILSELPAKIKDIVLFNLNLFT